MQVNLVVKPKPAFVSIGWATIPLMSLPLREFGILKSTQRNRPGYSSDNLIGILAMKVEDTTRYDAS